MGPRSDQDRTKMALRPFPNATVFYTKFMIDFGSSWAPSWLPLGPSWAPRCRLGAVLGSSWGLKMVLLGRLNHAPDFRGSIGSINCAPDPPKTAQDGPKMAKTTPKTTKNDPRTPQDDQKTSKNDAKRPPRRPKQDKTKIRQERTRQDAFYLLLSVVWSGLFSCLV